MVTDSGIKASASGERHVPQSIRSDGSVRKEIKIRPGYRPPEDVEVYKNASAEAFNRRGKYGVPGADPAPKQAEDLRPANKNAKRREAKRRNKSQGVDTDEAIAPTNDEADAPPAKNEEIDTEKQIRALRKKLRQARDLQSKKAAGADLMPDQFAKVIKIQELVRQLQLLGIDDSS